MAFKCRFVAFVALLALGLSHAQKQAPVLKDAPQEILFRVGGSAQTLKLECDVESGVSSDITSFQWYKDGKKVDPKADSRIEQNGGSLRFKDPKNEDESKYHCLATSSAGVASTRVISVKRAYINAPKVSAKRIKPVEGKPFKLDCAIPESYPKPTIEWKKQSTADSSKTQTVADGRITISPEGDLYFSNATESDVITEYKYVCVAKSPAVDGEVTLAEHFVEGLEKNPSPDNEVVQQYVTPNGATAKVGDVTMLYCIYGGSPLAHPDWYKDGVNVNNSPEDRVTRYNRSKGKRLLIKETLLEDEGEYKCVIDNEVGKVQNYTFRLNIVSAPKFVNKPEKRVQAKEGDDLFLPCEIQAKPEGKLTWTHNAEPVALSRRVVFSNKGLTINKVQKSDSGYYGCKGVNSIGDDYVETFVQVA